MKYQIKDKKHREKIKKIRKKKEIANIMRDVFVSAGTSCFFNNLNEKRDENE